MNNIVEYNNLILILLVFDIFPRITNNDILVLSTIKRVKVIKLAITKIIKLYTTR